MHTFIIAAFSDRIAETVNQEEYCKIFGIVTIIKYLAALHLNVKL